METYVQQLKRLQEYIESQERAKARRTAIARRSFIFWMDKAVYDVGRTLGYFIRIPQKVVKSIYKWLFD